MMTEAPEPKDKLDAATATVGVVNGPEDATFDWRQIDWRRVEADVRRLRQRIFTATKAGELARVRQLQKLMLRSHANTLLSVRRVTERNAGRLTAGVDGEVVLTPEAKARLADRRKRVVAKGRGSSSLPSVMKAIHAACLVAETKCQPWRRADQADAVACPTPPGTAQWPIRPRVFLLHVAGRINARISSDRERVLALHLRQG